MLTYLVILGLGVLWNLAVWWQVRGARLGGAGLGEEPIGATFHQMTSWGAWLPVLFALPWMAGFNAYSSGAMLSLAWVLPLSAFVSGFQTAQGWGQGRGRRVMSAVLTAYNLLLFLVLAVRYLSYVGLGLGLPGDGLLLDDAWGQARNASIFALFAPVFVLPPLLLPLGGPSRRAWTVVAVIPTLVAFTSAWDWLVTYPPALGVVRGMRALPLPAGATPRREDFVFSARLLSPLSLLPPSRFLERDLATADELGLNGVTLTLSVDILEHPGDLEKLGARLSRLKAEGKRVVVACWLPEAWIQRPGNSEKLLEGMQRLGPRVAEVCRPDLLALYADPYGAPLLAMGGRRRKPEFWARTLTEAARSVKAARPGTRVCAVFSELTKEEQALFRALARPDSAVDVLAFSLYPTFLPPRRFAERLSTAERWMREAPDKTFWVLGTGLSPQSHGEAAQARALRVVGEWAVRQSRLEGLSLHSLGDYGEVMGLVSSTGRRRQAFGAIREVIRAAHRKLSPHGAGQPRAPGQGG